MIVLLSKRFIKEFSKLPKNIQEKIWVILDNLEITDTLNGFPDCKVLEGYKNYFRIRVASYRIGLEIVDNEIKLIHIITVRSRGDIYK
ncbi:MAG: type II toxin-antitoxin system RelE/ParE family toxin, partial [Pseudarcicella sp.]|nr:type II toxin-antitoxin system RelE/ParE family toxin [Pseudarcicella sp.]